ncbi:GtrA family protein [Dankookia sp. P2]|uniref:GtrA family protein n=1 Tax=Dankookia sp. P2 TaxID=3423955 RepID=UPI003D66A6E9
MAAPPVAWLKPGLSRLLGEFLRFGVVGTAGFLVDVAVLTGAMAAGAGPYGGRVLSYLAAATATWALNRHWTFRHRGKPASASRQWLLFLLVNLIGFAINYGTYAALLGSLPLVRAYPALGVAAGSIAGLAGNFLLSRRIVFAASRAQAAAGP